MTYTEPTVLATYKATSTIQASTGAKQVGMPDTAISNTTNPAYEADE